jgi:hypothetical protein
MLIFFLIFSLCRSIVLGERFTNAAISFVVLPRLTRSAILISADVRPIRDEDNWRENGDMISSKLDSISSV